ncbi:MAG: tRNA guanosine(34) transglycosylase Tgt [Patescibacteria group bacterium]|nr:tRNA guanosine(34) transglycosylase Tgt [Patescibacteria group bacterium]
MSFSFEIEKKLKGTRARAGIIHTSHGVIHTPAFIAVGTKATVKALSPEQVAALGAEAVLANTYHLYLEPGERLVHDAGGLGKFMNWSGPTFTDSGGFQVFSLGAAYDASGVGRSGISKVKKENGKSKKENEETESEATLRGEGDLRARRRSYEEFSSKKISVLPNSLKSRSLASKAVLVARSRLDSDGFDKTDVSGAADDNTFSPHEKLARIDEDGVSFSSVLDGSLHRFTPEKSIQIQHDIGADIIFAFDECTSPHASREYQREAMERTHRWAERSLAEHVRLKAESQALFGIVQGGRFEDLRRESARIIGGMDFDGFGIGGSFDKEDMYSVVGWVNDILPPGKPRHLLGIGEPADLFGGIENGADTFDCVAPTRLGRNGTLYTPYGTININNAAFKSDLRLLGEVIGAPDSAIRPTPCSCYTCTHYSAAYLAHLFRAKEMFAATLASIHNLYFITNLVKAIRQSILDGGFLDFKKEFIAKYKV